MSHTPKEIRTKQKLTRNGSKVLIVQEEDAARLRAANRKSYEKRIKRRLIFPTIPFSH